MSKGDKSAKQALIRMYGAECFIDKLKLRDNTERTYIGKTQYRRMKELTYHHIIERRNGGQATVENGAILSAENHEWFNKQTPEKQRELNKAFQEYKINCVTLNATPKGIELNKLEPVEISQDDIPEEIQVGIIEVENMTYAEQQMLIERRKRQYAKFGKEYKPEVKHATLDREWQREIMQDVIDEMRY